jgi:hypothetical protein
MRQTQEQAIRDMANRNPQRSAADTTEQIRVQGLALQDMARRPLSWFKHNPENDVFAALKTPTYWQALERDIREAGAILSPLIAMPDGTLIEGESRLTIARKLAVEGLLDFDVLPVRIIKGDLSEEERRRRLYLGNLSRFEIDPDTRAALYAQIWSDLTHEVKRGRPADAGEGKTDTVSVFAEAAGITERQARREKEIIERAEKERKAEGAPTLKPEHVKKARAKANARRREKTKAAVRETLTGLVDIRLPRGHAELVLQALRMVKPKSGPLGAAIREIEKALQGARRKFLDS